MLMSRLNRRQSQRLLETALDAGFTHFDTARLYGYGEAEAALGSAISGRRDKLTVTTKVGILPPRRTPYLDLAKSVGRRAAVFVPQLRFRLRRRADAMVQWGIFDIPAITASLETSLRQLKTDYVDFLLLHECSIQDMERPELLEFLEEVKRKGKIRYYGLAATAPVTEVALVRFQEYARVVQFPSSAFEPTIDRLDLRSGPAIFTHSPLSQGFAQLYSELSRDLPWAAQWSSRLGIDCLNRSALGRLALHFALQMNPAGVVLFASASESNIRCNAKQVGAAIDCEQMWQFGGLVDEFRRTKVVSRG